MKQVVCHNEYLCAKDMRIDLENATKAARLTKLGSQAPAYKEFKYVNPKRFK